MFVREKPQVCQKYFLTEVNIAELDQRERGLAEMQIGFRWNFAESTSKEVRYMDSPYINAFLTNCLKSIKKKEGADILKFSPRKKEDGSNTVVWKNI